MSRTDYLLLAVGLMLFATLVGFHLWVRRLDYLLGRRARRDGLPFNSAWAERTQLGWLNQAIAELQQQRKPRA